MLMYDVIPRALCESCLGTLYIFCCSDLKMPEQGGEGGMFISVQEVVPVYTVKQLAANQYAYTDPLTTPVEKCFDWNRELKDLVTFYGREFYLVVFRSIRKSSADNEMLYNANAAAQEEARLSGGLLKYWYGILNERRECLAMCIWASREDAVKAIHKPAHRVAMKLTSAMYDIYTLPTSKPCLHLQPGETPNGRLTHRAPGSSVPLGPIRQQQRRAPQRGRRHGHHPHNFGSRFKLQLQQTPDD
ncbi:hypothetical protein M758_4G193900 [Ceratodon purpureus]|nr:hypothetical protein M758_4G193900 [Ceratodon purpureus]